MLKIKFINVSVDEDKNVSREKGFFEDYEYREYVVKEGIIKREEMDDVVEEVELFDEEMRESFDKEINGLSELLDGLEENGIGYVLVGWNVEYDWNIMVLYVIDDKYEEVDWSNYWNRTDLILNLLGD